VFNGLAYRTGGGFVVGLFYVTYDCHVWQSRCLFQLCREMHRGFVTKAHSTSMSISK